MQILLLLLLLLLLFGFGSLKQSGLLSILLYFVHINMLKLLWRKHLFKTSLSPK